jgi:putative aldouronate transport system substrate-binding protein
MKRTVITALICAVAALPLFAGGQGAASTGTGTRRTDGWFAGRNFSKHLDIEYAAVDINEGRDHNNGDEWVKRWTTNFNITYNVTALNWTNWDERLRIWINSNDAPEWFMWKIGRAHV